MPRRDYKTCKSCRKHVSEVGPVSHTRLCSDCADAILVENIIGISTHSGPAFLRWRRACAAAVGGVLLDELEAKP